ncbi:hypothetical protein PAAG_12230 [Paracoccidioides lutzii Pb01]|uniref:Uncharacterized protein n=1 Tax=Paracoccidioides lutzii (strain ATCC MYA-826 / Pb01) TaxID=502779 RepID=A0A0A2V414_PARBA|nr:hypothetical protein PAAG_12230 [Paracoccidioides lutzii Pb01]KGQ01102.1 hypothetical protein PAAG_12230 [Paracoccidioides lutzii Pb01]
MDRSEEPQLGLGGTLWGEPATSNGRPPLANAKLQPTDDLKYATLRWERTYIGEIASEWLVRPDVQFRIESMLLIYRVRKADDISSVVIRWLNEKKLGSGSSRYPETETIQTTEIAIARWGQSVYQHCI